MVFHHTLAFCTLLFMFIASWASPGRPTTVFTKELQRMDEIIQEVENTESKECIVEIGKSLLHMNNDQQKHLKKLIWNVLITP
jgi:hypothetical protein